MEILKLLDQALWVEEFELQDLRQWENGFYYRLKILIVNHTILYAREYVDEVERFYSFHWQDQESEMIIRWDNAPHHRHISTFPHHKHTQEGISESLEITLPDVLEEIQKQINPFTS